MTIGDQMDAISSNSFAFNLVTSVHKRISMSCVVFEPSNNAFCFLAGLKINICISFLKRHYISDNDNKDCSSKINEIIAINIINLSGRSIRYNIPNPISTM